MNSQAIFLSIFEKKQTTKNTNLQEPIRAIHRQRSQNTQPSNHRRFRLAKYEQQKKKVIKYQCSQRFHTTFTTHTNFSHMYNETTTDAI